MSHWQRVVFSVCLAGNAYWIAVLGVKQAAVNVAAAVFTVAMWVALEAKS